MPTPTLTVARFHVGRPARPGRPGPLRVRRHGTTIVASWRGPAGAVGYGVVLRQRNGLQRLVRLAADRRSVRLPRVATNQSGTVTVRALGPLVVWGKASTARFRATSREVSRFRPFRNLGRRHGR